MERAFHSPTHGELSLLGILDKMESFRLEDPGAEYRLLIGTDSMPSSTNNVTLVTAIVLHRRGRGAIYFWRNEKHTKLFTLRQRMYQEALTSIDIAQLFVKNTLGLDLLSGDIEIHVDIGHVGPTREMIREIVGMVKANGFPVRTKPDSVAASKVADRHT